MRITQVEMYELKEVARKHELPEDRCAIHYNEKDGRFVFFGGRYSFEFCRNSHSAYNYTVLWPTHSEKTTHAGDWNSLKNAFSTLAAQIKSEIEVGKVLDLRIKKTFSKMIIAFSPKFNEIYNQSEYAENAGLDEICGFGYRKSFEFLIKDYVKRGKTKDEKKRIESMAIMQCIRDYVPDDRVKALSERVLWLGNDHAHYMKLWKGKTVEDMKRLIELAIEWIDAHEEIQSINKRMSREVSRMKSGKKKPPPKP